MANLCLSRVTSRVKRLHAKDRRTKVACMQPPFRMRDSMSASRIVLRRSRLNVECNTLPTLNVARARGDGAQRARRQQDRVRSQLRERLKPWRACPVGADDHCGGVDLALELVDDIVEAADGGVHEEMLAGPCLGQSAAGEREREKEQSVSE